MNIYDIIKKTILNTEKARDLMNTNEYVFVVDKKANKLQIKEAVEKLFKVKVLSVNTLNTKPIKARSRMTVYTISGYKKAIVKLADGEKISAYEM